MTDRRTFIRRRTDPALAGRLQGRVGRFEGEWVEVPCSWCGGTGTYIGGDESHTCWCQSDEDRSDLAAKGLLA